MSEQLPFENLETLLPIDFFSVSIDLCYSKTLKSSSLFSSSPVLPSFSQFLAEESFADFTLVWNEEGLLGEVEVKKPFENSVFPRYGDGDSIEVFIDTRDRKSAGFATKFCHHFVFLANEVQGVRVQEMTKFRSEDSHPHCDPHLIEIETKFSKKDYTLSFFLPVSVLNGYDPIAFPRIGFTYKINRHKGLPQHFSVSSQYFDIMQHPSLWSSLKLVKN